MIVSAAAAWYMRTYAVMLDPTMVQNVLRTDSHEARELLNWDMVMWVLAWSALPLLGIWVVRLQPVKPMRAVLLRAGSVLAAFVIAVLAFLAISRDLTSFMRNEREARYLITPGNYLYGLAVNSVHRVEDAHQPRETIGADARFIRVSNVAGPRVLVLVIGETARAANFSLLGYPRETNPELAGADITAFSNVTSCGTSTEVSVPCMFSPYGRANYDERRIRNSEGLLDVLARAGYAVKWLDNQSGCKGVCKGAGIEFEKTCKCRRVPRRSPGAPPRRGACAGRKQHGLRAAHDRKSRPGLLPAIPGRIPPLPARLRDRGAARLHARAGRERL